MKLSNLNLPIILLLVLGHISLLGKFIGNPQVQGLGFITTASPLPLVFSQFRGVEAFASSFFVLYEVDNEALTLEVSPKVYESLRGPYNRRNVYGAAIAGAPVLTKDNEKPMIDSIHQQGFCGGRLKKEFGIPESAQNIHLKIVSHTKGSEQQWIIPVNCHE